MIHRTLPLAVLTVLLAASGTSLASEQLNAGYGDKGSLNGFPDHTLPVLVQVNSQGRVTKIDPAYELSPALDKMVRDTVTQMISKPAVDKHGKPIPSEFVLNLALASTERADGKLDTQFNYVSTQPVPSGRWYWAHEDGRNLALVDASRGDRVGIPHVPKLQPPPNVPPPQPNPQPQPDQRQL